jgi:hypothetical protein
LQELLKAGFFSWKAGMEAARGGGLDVVALQDLPQWEQM